MSEQVWVRLEEQDIPRGHFHWIAVCHEDDCGYRQAFGSSTEMTYDQAQAWIDETNHKAGREFCHLEVEVVL